MCGLSRQRFAQLVKAGVFPPPLYDVATRRPFYSEDMQQVCLEVRRRNFGINGKAVLFYARRTCPTATAPKVPKAEKTNVHPEILDGLKALGPDQRDGHPSLRSAEGDLPQWNPQHRSGRGHPGVFMYLRRKNAGVNVASK